MSTNTTIPTSVKWGKETIELDLVVADGVKGYKAALEERTGVPSDRMKLMPKSKGLWKGVLKDDFNLSTINFQTALSKSNPIQILLMGSATKLVAPKTKTVFIEDLAPEEVAKHTPEPSGLINLGNTCYLNSVLQCLRRVPQLRKALEVYRPGAGGGGSGGAGGRDQTGAMLLSALKDLYTNLDRTTTAVSPSNVVMLTKIRFPQFGQTGPQGQPMQQDAEEFYSGLATLAAEEIRGMEGIKTGFDGEVEGCDGVDNLVDAVFGMKMEETLTCDELATKMDGAMDVDGEQQQQQEPSSSSSEVKSYDFLRKLVCNIQGGADGQNVNINTLQDGLHLSLSGKIEKYSDELQRNAIWTRKQRIMRLPPILVVQFGRFYWKATPDSQDHAGVKCKVMKPVAFSDTLDIYQFCTEKVKSILKVYKDKAAQEEEDHIAKKLKSADVEEKEEGKDEGKEGEKEEGGTAMDTDEVIADYKTNHEVNDDEAAELKAALAMSMGNDEQVEVLNHPPVGPGLPKEFQGIYELFAVVTHKGRDADGGHYMGWVKADQLKVDDGKTKKKDKMDEENEDWFVFDDDEVSPCKTEDVLKLKGGGDWHMSYLNFYRAKK